MALRRPPRADRPLRPRGDRGHPSRPPLHRARLDLTARAGDRHRRPHRGPDPRGRARPPRPHLKARRSVPRPPCSPGLVRLGDPARRLPGRRAGGRGCQGGAPGGLGCRDLPCERRTAMARPYPAGAKRFVFGAGDGSNQQVSAADAQEAYEAFSLFFRSRDGDAAVSTFTIGDEEAGQRLVLMPGRGVIARVDGADRPRSEYLRVDRANRYLPSAMLFFENGHAGLDHFGQWFGDLSDLDAPPEIRGAARAAAFTTEAAALEEVARIWADSGIVDPSDRFHVFFDSQDLDDDRAERAELLALIAFLGIERVDAPDGSPGGEVWVRTDARLDAACARWA
ncbi:DUF6357 family protein [Streptomyces sp. NPDC048606]|uniref:DUF6357 family protein n=1 Tax=Streptomyces sp. NPDC048606 TaxID=3154726 RepID=UPI0034171CD8